MTREEAINILNRDDDSMRRGYFCINDFLAIEVLKLEEPRWIPVTEKLPEVEGATRCLVTVDNCAIDDYTAIRSYFPDTKDFNDTVTAWMPLPEPYKGGE